MFKQFSEAETWLENTPVHYAFYSFLAPQSQLLTGEVLKRVQAVSLSSSSLQFQKNIVIMRIYRQTDERADGRPSGITPLPYLV